MGRKHVRGGGEGLKVLLMRDAYSEQAASIVTGKLDIFWLVNQWGGHYLVASMSSRKRILAPDSPSFRKSWCLTSELFVKSLILTAISSF